MPAARDEIEEERQVWQQAFDRLADYLRELQRRGKQDDGQEPSPKPSDK